MPHKAIAELLRNDTATAAIVGSRIRPAQLSPGTSLPYVAYQLVSDVPEHHFGGPLGFVEARIQVEAWAIRYDDAKTLADTIRKAIDGYSGTVVGIEIHALRRELSIDIQPVSDAGKGMPSIYGVSSDYFVQYQENIT